MGPLFEYAKKHITFKTVAESEDIVLVLRAHLLIESFLDLILCHGLFQGNQDLYDNLDFNFSKKQNLAKRILHNELIEAISAINKIRTKFAHDLEAKLEAIDLIVLDKIYSKKMETIKWEVGQPPDPKNLKLMLTIYLFGVLGALNAAYDLMNPESLQETVNG